MGYLWKSNLCAISGCHYEQPGIGLLTGPACVGETVALRQITAELNPQRFFVLYSADTDFSRFDRYRNLALALGLEPAFRRAQRHGGISQNGFKTSPRKNIACRFGSSTKRKISLPDFFRDLPAFLNFAFDSNDCMTVWFVDLQQLAATLSRAPYSALTAASWYAPNSTRSSNTSASASSFNTHFNRPDTNTPYCPIQDLKFSARKPKAHPDRLASSCKRQ